MNRIWELYGTPTKGINIAWAEIVSAQACPFTQQRCRKIRKSAPEVTIGSCTVAHGRGHTPIMICPNRFLERHQIFFDCLHLLTLHEPGNELHVVPEVSIPGGSVDYFLVSARHGRVVDFVAIELQTVDTTGTVWPARQAFLHEQGILTGHNTSEAHSFGMNWKMTAKTILVQLSHKIQTLENVNKHLVLVIQEPLLAYMQRAFQFDHITPARLGDAAQFHIYALQEQVDSLRLQLAVRLSTDAAGIATSLGLQADPNIELEQLLTTLEAKVNDQTRLQIG